MIIDKRVYLPIKGIYSKFILADINSTNVPYPVKNPMTEPRYIDAILIKIVVNVIRKLHENHKKNRIQYVRSRKFFLIVTAESQQSPNK